MQVLSKDTIEAFEQRIPFGLGRNVVGLIVTLTAFVSSAFLLRAAFSSVAAFVRWIAYLQFLLTHDRLVTVSDIADLVIAIFMNSSIVVLGWQGCRALREVSKEMNNCNGLLEEQRRSGWRSPASEPQ